jgi:D-aminoacyl-tRNA deacylase
MRALIQRVARAQVTVDSRITGRIGNGLLVFLGVGKADTESDAEYLAEKIAGLRIFCDSAGRMNASVVDAGGSLLVVSQFTLYGNVKKGRRPSFDQAAPPDLARRLYEYFLVKMRERISDVQTGEFQAHMEVELLNNGPVTLLCETPSDWSDNKISTTSSTGSL